MKQPKMRENPCSFPASREVGCRRPVSSDCLRHQEVRANEGGFRVPGVPRSFKGLARGYGGLRRSSSRHIASPGPNSVPSLCTRKFGFPRGDLAKRELAVRVLAGSALRCLQARDALRFDRLLESERLPLICPDQRKVHEALDPEAAGQSTLDASLYESWAKESE